jgi:hypothetical protein
MDIPTRPDTLTAIARAVSRAKARGLATPLFASPEPRSGPQAATSASSLRFCPTLAKHWVFRGRNEGMSMRRLLFASAAAVAALAATPAAAQLYIGYGYSPYSYGYSYPSYSYGYSPYSYSYSPYSSYGYSYPSYSYGYSNYGYSYPSYSYGSYYSCRPRRHHRDGVVWYTRGC